jgi:hypothetical protein
MCVCSDPAVVFVRRRRRPVFPHLSDVVQPTNGRMARHGLRLKRPTGVARAMDDLDWRSKEEEEEKK